VKSEKSYNNTNMAAADDETDEYENTLVNGHLVRNRNTDTRTLSFPQDIHYNVSPEPSLRKTAKPSSQIWSRGAESLSSCWGFTLSLHSVLVLPVALLQHGGLTFLLMYTFLLVLLGCPLLLTELFLGQYSGLGLPLLYRHLCPLLSGLGMAVAMQAFIRSLLSIAVASWLARGAMELFLKQGIPTELLYSQILMVNGTSIQELGALNGELTLSLGAVSLVSFILVAASVRTIGKVSLLAVPLCYGLLLTLCIRSGMDPAGPEGFLKLMKPNWSVLSEATTWLEAAAHVAFSLQLGTGVISTYGSYNKFMHNIIRDCWTIIVGHIFWVFLSIFMVLSLLGVAYKEDAANLRNLSSEISLLSITGEGIWLGAVTLLQSSFSELSYAWLWSGLFLILLIIINLISLLGTINVIADIFVNYKMSCLRFKPLVTLFVILCLAITCLCFATNGGIHVYYLLKTFIFNWPLLFFVVINNLLASFSNGMGNLIRDLSSMCRKRVSHFSSSHFSVIITSVSPIFLSVRYLELIALISTCIFVLDQSRLDFIQSNQGTFKTTLGNIWCFPSRRVS